MLRGLRWGVIHQVKASGVKVNNLVCFEPESKIYKELATTARREVHKVADNIFVFKTLYLITITSTLLSREMALGLGSIHWEIIWCSAQSLMTLYQAFYLLSLQWTLKGKSLRRSKVQKIICDNKPSLAVCVYHYPEQVADVINKYLNLIQSIFLYPKLHRIPNRDCTVRCFSNNTHAKRAM